MSGDVGGFYGAALDAEAFGHVEIIQGGDRFRIARYAPPQPYTRFAIDMAVMRMIFDEFGFPLPYGGA